MTAVEVHQAAYELLALALGAAAVRDAKQAVARRVDALPAEERGRVLAVLAIEVALRGTTRRDRGVMQVRVIQMREQLEELARRGEQAEPVELARVLPLRGRRRK